MSNRATLFFDANAVDKASPVPLHYQLKGIILSGIRRSNLAPGDHHPTEIELASQFNMSWTTVRQALVSLVSDGYLYRIKSKGTFVSKPKIDLHYVMDIESFNSQIERSGQVPKTRVLHKSVGKYDLEIASNLKIEAGENVIKLIRLRSADEVPVAIAESYHPLDICRQLLERDLEQLSLLDVLAERSDSEVVLVRRTIEAVGASHEDSKLLCVEPGFSLQYSISTSYNKNGRIVEYCLSRYRGDKNIFSVELVKRASSSAPADTAEEKRDYPG